MSSTGCAGHFAGKLLLASAFFLSLSFLSGPRSPASATERREADQLVEKARFTLENFMCDGNMAAFRDLIRKAEGVMVFPSLLKGAFIVGASGGNGVLLVRDRSNGTWSGPAFYSLGGASFGLQAGGQSSEVILLAMTERGVSSFLGNSVKLGGDVGVAIGPVGVGASVATENLSADILSFSRSKGLYGGMSLDGAVLAVRDALNGAYYGKKASPAEILVTHAVARPDRAILARSVAEAASGSAAVGCKERARSATGGTPSR